MVAKLQRPGEAPTQMQAPAGWGAPPAQQAAPQQREAIQSMITTGQPPAGFSGAVGGAMAASQEADYGAAPAQVAQGGWGQPAQVFDQPTPAVQPAEPPKRTRRTKAEMEAEKAAQAQPVEAPAEALPSAAQAADWQVTGDGSPASSYDLARMAQEKRYLKLELLKMVFADGQTDWDSGMDQAREAWAFISDV